MQRPKKEECKVRKHGGVWRTENKQESKQESKSQRVYYCGSKSSVEASSSRPAKRVPLEKLVDEVRVSNAWIAHRLECGDGLRHGVVESLYKIRYEKEASPVEAIVAMHCDAFAFWCITGFCNDPVHQLDKVLDFLQRRWDLADSWD